MKFSITTLIFTIAFFAYFASADPRQERMVERTFPRKDLIKIWTLAGAVTIQPSPADMIEVKVVYAPLMSETFEPIFEESDSTLSLREHIEDSYDGGSNWTILVPAGVKIECTSVAGDLNFSGVSGKIFCSTKAGKITLENCRGGFDVHTTSGDLLASAIQVDGASIFASLSGSVTVTLAKAPAGDLSVSSSFDETVLDYRGTPLQGKFEFSAREIKGEIFAPVAFDYEEKFVKDDLPFMRKGFIRGQETPFIQIRTSEGVARLKQ